MTFMRKFFLRFRTISTLVVVGLLVMAPFIASARVSAEPVMDHSTETILGCISACTSNQGAVSQKDLIFPQEEKHTPTPPPDKPYYIRHQNLGFSVPLPPQDLITSSSFKPPDLNALNSQFKF